MYWGDGPIRVGFKIKGRGLVILPSFVEMYLFARFVNKYKNRNMSPKSRRGDDLFPCRGLNAWEELKIF